MFYYYSQYRDRDALPLKLLVSITSVIFPFLELKSSEREGPSCLDDGLGPSGAYLSNVKNSCVRLTWELMRAQGLISHSSECRRGVTHTAITVIQCESHSVYAYLVSNYGNPVAITQLNRSVCSLHALSGAHSQRYRSIIIEVMFNVCDLTRVALALSHYRR